MEGEDVAPVPPLLIGRASSHLQVPAPLPALIINIISSAVKPLVPRSALPHVARYAPCVVCSGRPSILALAGTFSSLNAEQ